MSPRPRLLAAAALCGALSLIVMGASPSLHPPSAIAIQQKALLPDEAPQVTANVRVADLLGDGTTQIFATEPARSQVTWVRIRRGLRRKIRRNDMDVESLISLCDEAAETEKFPYYKRIADVCLFMTGVFPNHYETGRWRNSPIAQSAAQLRRGQLALEQYEELGRRFYGLAERHPAWVKLIDDPSESTGTGETWPPREFRSRTGDYAAFARPEEPREPEIVEMRSRRRMHPLVRVEDGEAVIYNGEELHRYCKREGILFLFFLGFNTNACILLRDYGTVEMSKRGYEVIILRDCGTGMESFETQDGLWQTRGAILFLEMFGKYSITSTEMIAGLPGRET